MALEIGIKKSLEREPTARRRFVHHLTAAKTLTIDQTGSIFTNLGASGSVTVSLPTNAAGIKGIEYQFIVMAAQAFVINPGAAGALYIAGAKQSDAATISADDEGECVTVVSDGNGDWAVYGVSGTWTVA